MKKSNINTLRACPFFNWLNLFEKKWSVRIVKELYVKPLGFNELKKRISGITQGVLSQRLDELEASGVVKRKILKQKPLAVEYSLNEHVKGAFCCWKNEKNKSTGLKIKC